jgi:hypothetical protein
MSLILTGFHAEFVDTELVKRVIIERNAELFVWNKDFILIRAKRKVIWRLLWQSSSTIWYFVSELLTIIYTKDIVPCRPVAK